MKKTITLLLLLFAVFAVKAQVTIEMVNTTERTIDNLVAGGKAYGELLPGEAVRVSLPSVQVVQYVPQLAFTVTVEGADFNHTTETLGMAYASTLYRGSYKLGIVMVPGRFGGWQADVQLISPKGPIRMCGNQ